MYYFVLHYFVYCSFISAVVSVLCVVSAAVICDASAAARDVSAVVLSLLFSCVVSAVAWNMVAQQRSNVARIVN